MTSLCRSRSVPHDRPMHAPFQRELRCGASRYQPLIGTVLGLLALLMISSARAASAATPEEVLKTYLAAIYARDYTTAYAQIWSEDRTLKTKEEYIQENGAFSGAALELSRTLASHIRYEDLRTTMEGDRAIVTFKAILPDANDPSIDNVVLGFDEHKLAALSASELKAILDTLDAMAKSGRLPVVVGENERWDLVREGGAWRLFLNWAGAVLVHFEAVTKAGLPWEFAPVQSEVRAKPGETLQTSYRVKNLSDRQITGKAQHILKPAEERGYLEIVTCFCFLQQTLNPGEEQLLPVIFRMNYEVPSSLKEMWVRYEFYPLEQFPKDARQ